MADTQQQALLAKGTKVDTSVKISDALSFITAQKVGLLTTASPDGTLHSRTMAVAGTPLEAGTTKLSFIYNKSSHKDDAIVSGKEGGDEANIGFMGRDGFGDWLSWSGKATVSSDKGLIKKLWSPSIKAWFDDLKDGVHTGDENDDRVGVLQVEGDEVRHYHITRTLVGQAVEIASSVFSEKAAAPGELRVIRQGELIAYKG